MDTKLVAGLWPGQAGPKLGNRRRRFGSLIGLFQEGGAPMCDLTNPAQSKRIWMCDTAEEKRWQSQ